MASYGLLNQAEEGTISSLYHDLLLLLTSFALLDEYHKARLLNVEERPLKRILKRLLPSESPIVNFSLPPTPSPEGSDSDAIALHESDRSEKRKKTHHFYDDASLDYAAGDSSGVRMQFLQKSNEEERARYGTEKDRILSTMHDVRSSTAELRTQLEEAQRVLALRKSYDDLTDKITTNRLLKPREDQDKDYAKTWSERREQFGRIVEEGMQLRRLIRDEKEEVERREGMQEGEDGDDAEATSKGKASAATSPHPDTDNGATPQTSQDESSRLQVDKGSMRSETPLRQVTSVSGTAESTEDVDDTNMDEGEIAGEDEGEHSDELEEGEELGDDHMNGHMDTR
ncbi:hypothetical protein N7470_001527 [Penicillium chermesinum]|nr:hypothetical protein N7470_001527 [Penicillium chermesinum]